MPAPVIRPLDPAGADAARELALVAARMRSTLVEVIGEERGTALYTLEWLEDRARQHLDGRIRQAAILLAEVEGAVVGHTIVRVEGDRPEAFGLFSTTYVTPAARRRSVADALLTAGETWMRDRGMTRLVTYAAVDNVKLHRLYEKHGYVITERCGEMVRFERGR